MNNNLASTFDQSKTATGLRASQLYNETQNLECAAKTLDDAVQRLRDRFEPVLRSQIPSSTPAVAQPAPPRSVLVPAAEYIRASRERIDELVTQINDILERAEV